MGSASPASIRRPGIVTSFDEEVSSEAFKRYLVQFCSDRADDAPWHNPQSSCRSNTCTPALPQVDYETLQVTSARIQVELPSILTILNE